MRILDFGRDVSDPIAAFNSVDAASVSLGHGEGDVHVYSVHFAANSEIGPHPTGFCQLFLVVSGAGWVASADGKRVQIHSGQGAFFEKGEMHSKGSEPGMVAIMVQATYINPDADEDA